MELLRVTPENNLSEKLSALDKKCVGSDGWSAESFRSEVRKENGIVLCFTDGNEVIALLSGYFAEGEGDITSVAVDENFRRKGLAQKLIAEFIKILPDSTENIFLEVRESNISAIRLYEKCGFEKLSVRKNFYSNPCENAIVMIKKFMKYFIYENQRNSTCYHEWYKGHFDGISFWKSDSLLISEDMHFMLGLEEIFSMIIPDYDPVGETEVSENQWIMIMKKASETGGQIYECLKEADSWVTETFKEHNVFTMIGM
ncbi:MAG: ribosomal protein S18-alanine N-acetyltransferase [Ruminococcus sp.]|nr:ribosomal protein S18-alanine N-acetyltransferase [Ruminococcus sp.]